MSQTDAIFHLKSIAAQFGPIGVELIDSWIEKYIDEAAVEIKPADPREFEATRKYRLLEAERLLGSLIGKSANRFPKFETDGRGMRCRMASLYIRGEYR